MTLRADAHLALGDFHLDVELVAPAGEVTVVVGPNGAGKTTLLRVLAGTLALDSGAVSLDGHVLDAPPRTFVPPERRHLGVVHQDHLLFAHLDALDNVAFGPRCGGASVTQARAVAHQWLDRFGVGAQASMRPVALSGGQAQRVALARALASAPVALLLDEPLAALDATTRGEVRRDLRHHLAGFVGPTVLVTHDPLDALTLADRIVVMEDGRVVQSGTLAAVTARPRSRYLADLLGVNLVEGVASGGALTTPEGVVLPLRASQWGPTMVTVAPSAVRLSPPPTPLDTGRTSTEGVVGSGGSGEPGGPGRSAGRWLAEVAELEVVGDRARVRLGGPLDLLTEVPLTDVVALGLAPGSAVWVEVEVAALGGYPACGDD